MLWELVTALFFITAVVTVEFALLTEMAMRDRATTWRSLATDWLLEQIKAHRGYGEQTTRQQLLADSNPTDASYLSKWVGPWNKLPFSPAGSALAIDQRAAGFATIVVGDADFKRREASYAQMLEELRGEFQRATAGRFPRTVAEAISIHQDLVLRQKPRPKWFDRETLSFFTAGMRVILDYIGYGVSAGIFLTFVKFVMSDGAGDLEAQVSLSAVWGAGLGGLAILLRTLVASFRHQGVRTTMALASFVVIFLLVAAVN